MHLTISCVSTGWEGGPHITSAKWGFWTKIILLIFSSSDIGCYVCFLTFHKVFGKTTSAVTGNKVFFVCFFFHPRNVVPRKVMVLSTAGFGGHRWVKRKESLVLRPRPFWGQSSMFSLPELWEGWLRDSWAISRKTELLMECELCC